MKIRKIIEILERLEKESDQGENTQVQVKLHAAEWNTSGFYVDAPIEDIAIVYHTEDYVEIDVVVSNESIDSLKDLSREMV